MADISKLDVVVNALKKRAAEARKDEAVIAVGYDAAYALYVHENIEMKWRGKQRRPSPPHYGVYWGPAGQAKFLEQPARTLSKDGTVGKIVKAALAAGERLPQGLVLAGLRIQRDSQELVPIDTGNLKNSAFTVQEKP